MTFSKSLFIAILAFASSQTFDNESLAQNCSAGPQCQSAGNRGKSYMQQLSQNQSNGAFDASMVAYCAAMVTAEVNRVCAQEMRQYGRQRCASLLEQQEQEDLSSAQQAQATGAAVSASSWQEQCGW
jgi:hypothetical protein